MLRNPENDNKKCGETSSPENRVFVLSGGDANEANCTNKCIKNFDCLAFSGIWNIGCKHCWCIGCRVDLDTIHSGAVAYKESGISTSIKFK